MTEKPARHSTPGRILILGALLALALPGTAFAATTITVQTGGAAGGPGTANSVSPSNADCRNGDANDVVAGVGIDQVIGTGAEQSNLHVKGMVPYDGTAEYTTGYSPGTVDTDATQARGLGGTGGSMGGFDPTFSSTAYGMCLDPGGVIESTEIVMAVANGPTGAGAIDFAVATCPEDTRLLGGGARTIPDNQGSLKPIVSYPTYDDVAYNNGEIAADDGDINPDSWAAGGLNGGGTGMNNKTYAYAICGSEDPENDPPQIGNVTVTVRYNQASGPTSATAQPKTIVGCGGEDGTLISGGAGISGGNITSADFTAPGSQGDHLNGSYPSDVSGGVDTSSPTYWTARTHTGGSGSTGATQSHVWALCIDGN